MNVPKAYWVKWKRQWTIVPIDLLSPDERAQLLRDLDNRDGLERVVARLRKRKATEKLGEVIGDAFGKYTPAGYIMAGVSIEEQKRALEGPR